jgi:hypothetical protein
MLYSFFHYENRVPRRFKRTLLIIGCLYFLADMCVGIFSPMKSAYTLIAAIGGPCDLITYIGWIILYKRKKVKLAPVIAFSSHMVYIVFVFTNCFFAPYGRIAGLGLNTVAIFFASMPVNNNSWRFVEFMHNCRDEEPVMPSPKTVNSEDLDFIKSPFNRFSSLFYKFGGSKKNTNDTPIQE